MFDFKNVLKVTQPVLKQVPGIAAMNSKEIVNFAKDMMEGVKKVTNVATCNAKIKKEEALIMKNQLDIGKLIVEKNIKIADKEVNAILSKIKECNKEIATQKLNIKVLEQQKKGNDLMDDIKSIAKMNKEYFEKNFKIDKKTTKTAKKTSEK